MYAAVREHARKRSCTASNQQVYSALSKHPLSDSAGFLTCQEKISNSISPIPYLLFIHLFISLLHLNFHPLSILSSLEDYFAPPDQPSLLPSFLNATEHFPKKAYQEKLSKLDFLFFQYSLLHF